MRTDSFVSQPQLPSPESLPESRREVLTVQPIPFTATLVGFEMALSFDPDFLQAVLPLMPMRESLPKPGLHDIATRRSNLAHIFSVFSGAFAPEPEILTDRLRFKTYDGAELTLLHIHHVSSKTAGPSTPAIIHVHGGGMIAMSADDFAPFVVQQVKRLKVPMFSVDYRVAPEHPDPAATEDVFAALQYVQSHAVELNVDPARLAIMGESSGGGVAAGVALLARDRNMSPPLAKQILIYPMLDDRNLVPDEHLLPFAATWDWESNITGWTAYLGADRAGKPEADVSHYAAPARAKDLKGLPRTYLDVSGLDIFRDECLEYAARLVKAGVPLEFHLWEGVPHSFEGSAPNIPVSVAATARRDLAMTSI
jgi:acetyl esterase/lipase